VGDISFNEQDCTAAFKKLGEMVGSGLGQTWKKEEERRGRTMKATFTRGKQNIVVKLDFPARSFLLAEISFPFGHVNETAVIQLGHDTLGNSTWKNLDIKGSPFDFGAFFGGALDEAE
jgi:hypothetical protein